MKAEGLAIMLSPGLKAAVIAAIKMPTGFFTAGALGCHLTMVTTIDGNRAANEIQAPLLHMYVGGTKVCNSPPRSLFDLRCLRNESCAFHRVDDVRGDIPPSLRRNQCLCRAGEALN